MYVIYYMYMYIYSAPASQLTNQYMRVPLKRLIVYMLVRTGCKHQSCTLHWPATRMYMLVHTCTCVAGSGLPVFHTRMHKYTVWIEGHWVHACKHHGLMYMCGSTTNRITITD